MKWLALLGLSVYYSIIVRTVLRLSLLSTLFRLFTIMYLKQTMFLGYTVLRLFCMYSLCYMLKYVLLFYIGTSRSMCAVPLFWLFFLISAHTPSCVFSVSFFASICLAYIVCSSVSSYYFQTLHLLSVSV
jgi:hypothetical protein